MNKTKVYTAILRLAEIEHFFTIPAISPFSRDFQDHSYTSGIEYLARELYARPSVKEVCVTLLLPPDQIRPGLEQQTQQALLRYCRARVMEIEQEIRGLRRHALRVLALALVGMIVFIGLGGELTGSASLPVRLLGQGLIVLGWIFVWFPLDSLIFGPLYSQRDARIYKKLMEMQLNLKSSSGIDEKAVDEHAGEDLNHMGRQ
jgi:hypothetical protein